MLVVIFGSPRSGTTWLGKVLDAHPGVHYVHEPEIALPSRLPQFPDAADDEAAGVAREDMRRWLATRDLRSMGTRPVFRKDGEGLARFALRKAQVYGGKGLERLHAGLANALPVVGAFAAEPRVHAVKTVNMLGRAGALAAAFPDMRSIHLVRHPCGQVASMLRGHRGHFESREVSYRDMPDSPMGRREGLTLEALAAMPAVERLAWKWAAFNDAAFRALEGSGRALTVRYEDVTQAGAAGVRPIFDAIGLDWHDRVERFIRSSTAESGAEAGYYTLKRDPQQAAERWRSELPEADIARILDICTRTEVGRLAAGAGG